jgi:hypothetical protein
VNAWVNQIPSIGRNGVASGFLNSTEYRVKLVTALYFEVLKRTQANAPTPAQVGTWVNTGLDWLSLRVSFASTAEFFAAG